MSANASRRRRIVIDQKKPKPFVVTWYRDARSEIVNYFLSGGDPGSVEAALENLGSSEAGDNRKRQEEELSAEALAAFLDGQEDFEVWDVEYARAQSSAPKLEIGGVSVSVQPDLLIKGSRKGRPFRGALKIHIVKGRQLDDEAGVCAAAVLKQWVADHFATEEEPVHPDYCMVLDVFAGQLWRAPKSAKRRMDRVAAACEEIALRWPTVATD